MRRNVFLHFLNRDSREIGGLYRFYRPEDHARVLRRALNAAVAICEDYCILPPGFAIEDPIAFNLMEAQKEYLSTRILRFPMRESNLEEYAEKKRSEYYPLRSRYSGLFDDTRLGFLGRHATGLIRRKSHIGERIVSGWQEDSENPAASWRPIKKLISEPIIISGVAKIPTQLADTGTALTWSAIGPHLPDAARPAASHLRNALQHTYFKQYCDEFSLVILTSIPSLVEEFFLPRRPKAYDYHRMTSFLNVFEIHHFLLDAPARTIAELKQKTSFVSFFDSYVELANISASITELTFRTGLAARDCKFDWIKFGSRFSTLANEPTALEMLEFDDALREASQALASRFGLPSRQSAQSGLDKRTQMSRPVEVRSMPDVILFVALQEELDVLTKKFSLAKHSTRPAASGKIGNTTIAVLCPKEMGRVPAAAEVATYLQSRDRNLPKLIIVLGLAGGFAESKTAVGHIICPDVIVDLALRKVLDADAGGALSKFRRRDFPTNRALRNLLESDDFDKKAWIDAAIGEAEWPIDRRPSLHYGLIASADEVVASNDWQTRLLGHTEKLLGIEMEGGGVGAAAELFGVPVSMLRVVSDQADPAKSDDSWRSRGMKTVAILLEKLPFQRLIEMVSR